MSSIVEFFVAPDDTSAAEALRHGPGQAFESLSFGNFDVEEAVVEWECLLAGGSFDELVDAGEPRFVAEHDDGGSVVFAVSSRLSAALAAAERSRLREAAVTWAERRAADGEVVHTEIAEAILTGLAALVGSARHRDQAVYCWVA
ncbi:hypothetical protein ACWDV7_25780 [Streptomyces sp. NPDC003362]